MMRNFQHAFSKRGLLVAAAVTQALVCASNAAEQGSPVPVSLNQEEVGSGPGIVILDQEFPATLDPQVASTFGLQLATELFDTLVDLEIDPATGLADQSRLVPRLAKSWGLSEDKKVLTFHLHPDAKFWDGTQVTAEDVYFTIERAIVGRTGWGAVQIETGGISSMDQVEVVDPSTIRISYPDGIGRYSLINFASVSLAIISKAACVAASNADDSWCVEWIKRNAMGSGPYKLEESKSGEWLTLAANKDYWGDTKPYYSKITYRIVPDVQTRMLLMEAGESDIAFLTPREYSVLKQSPSVYVYSVPKQQDVAVLRWKTDIAPFDDVKIREAVIRSIPYDRLVNEVCLSFCTRVHNLIGVNTPGYSEDALFSQDMDAARKLIEESKYAGQVPPFEVQVEQDSDNLAAAVIIQDSLRQVGMTMNIKPMTKNAYADLSRVQRNVTVSIHNMDPFWNDFMYWAYWMYNSDSSTNHIRYSNAQLDKDTSAALLIPNEEDNRAKYEALQNETIGILKDERLAAPLFQVNWTVAASAKICNMNKLPWGTMRFSQLRPCS